MWFGLITKQILDFGAKSYTGYDISSNAIDRAKRISKKKIIKTANISLYPLTIYQN